MSDDAIDLRRSTRPVIIDRMIVAVLWSAATLAFLVTIGIVLSLLSETIRFFGKVPIREFLFGLEWSPQTAIREDQIGAEGSFGAIPLITMAARFTTDSPPRRS